MRYRLHLAAFFAALMFTSPAMAGTTSTVLEPDDTLTAECRYGYGSLAGGSTPLYTLAGERLHRAPHVEVVAVGKAWRYIFKSDGGEHRVRVYGYWTNDRRDIANVGERRVEYRDECIGR